MNRVSQRHPDQTHEPPQLVSFSDRKEWLWAPRLVGSNQPSSGETHLTILTTCIHNLVLSLTTQSWWLPGSGHRCIVCKFRALPCGSAPSSPQQQHNACSTVDVSPHCLSMSPSIFPLLLNKTLWCMNLLWLGEGLGMNMLDMLESVNTSLTLVKQALTGS